MKTIFEGHKAQVFNVRFSAHSKSLLTGSVDKTIRLWAVNSPLADTFSSQGGTVLSVAFSPNGQTIATVSND